MSTDVFCPIHPGVHLVEDHRAGDVICPECGLVVGDRYVFLAFFYFFPGLNILKMILKNSLESFHRVFLSSNRNNKHFRNYLVFTFKIFFLFSNISIFRID